MIIFPPKKCHWRGGMLFFFRNSSGRSPCAAGSQPSLTSGRGQGAIWPGRSQRWSRWLCPWKRGLNLASPGNGWPSPWEPPKQWAGWWFQPLRKIWVRQLGLWISQYMESHKIPWFQTTNRMWIFIMDNYIFLKWLPSGHSRDAEGIIYLPVSIYLTLFPTNHPTHVTTKWLGLHPILECCHPPIFLLHIYIYSVYIYNYIMCIYSVTSYVYIYISYVYIFICTHCILYISIFHILYKYMYIIYVKMYVKVLYLYP